MSTLATVIARGTNAARPAAGNPGRLYFDTTNNQLTRDNGTTWDVVEGAGGMTNPMTTAGDIITGGTAGAAGRLAVGSASQVLTVVSGAPAWATPAAAAAASEDWWNVANKPASPSAYDKEFTEGTTVGTLTRVSAATPKGTWAESLSGLHFTHTVTGAGIELDVYAQSVAGLAIGDYATIAATMPSSVPAYMGPFVGFSDGATFGTSNAIGLIDYFPTAANYRGLLNQFPGMNSRAIDGTTYDASVPGMSMGWRVKYEAANTWGLYARWPGSTAWKTVQSNYSYTLTPTHVLFGVLVWNSAVYSADNGAVIRLECFRYND